MLSNMTFQWSINTIFICPYVHLVLLATGTIPRVHTGHKDICAKHHFRRREGQISQSCSMQKMISKVRLKLLKGRFLVTSISSDLIGLAQTVDASY